MKKICEYCGNEFFGRKENQFCSRDCASNARRGKSKYGTTTRICEYCGKSFETSSNPKFTKRFCNTSCSAYWRNKTFGPNLISEEQKQKNSEMLKQRWQNTEFRNSAIERMKTNNPVYMPGVVERTKASRIKNGSYVNHFMYGNGKISPYEYVAKDYLQDFGFKYNISIPLKSMRDKYPERMYPTNYKPDFTNIELKICIEIDGPTHLYKSNQMKDKKKTECLEELGYKVYRFTHEQITSGEFYAEVNKLWENYSQKHIITK